VEEPFWAGNEDWQHELDERIDAASDPGHFTNRTTDAWRHVKNAYRQNQPQGTPNSNSQDPAQKWHEITDLQGRHLHYDDSFNSYRPADRRCLAGQPGREFLVGHFRVKPYVWDHSNTGCVWLDLKRRAAQADQTAGGLQRASAFLISRQGLEGAKRTFFVGSGGEMGGGWSGGDGLPPENGRPYTDALYHPLPEVATDLLIQAILPARQAGWLGSLLGENHPASFVQQIPYYCNFMVRQIEVTGAVVFVHFDDFIQRLPHTEEYREDFENAINYNLRELQNAITRLPSGDWRARNYNRLFRAKSFYVMQRRGFECQYPSNASGFADELPR
jgi:hypothetical protein